MRYMQLLYLLAVSHKGGLLIKKIQIYIQNQVYLLRSGTRINITFSMILEFLFLGGLMIYMLDVKFVTPPFDDVRLRSKPVRGFSL